jgi:hypothetical protein
VSWPQQESHARETRAVRQALNSHGIKAEWIRHGRATAWDWLEINLGKQAAGNRALQDEALRIAKSVTGRQGDYTGRILILTQ